MKTAVIAGSRGLIGEILTKLLLNDNMYGKVISLGRRKLDISNPKLEQKIVDFNNLDKVELPCDDVFCCLGTTIKKAGSQANFRKVDFNFPANLAERSKASRAKRFLLVSSLGADAKSKVFYSSVKGETEAVIAQTGFETVHIFRPSILLGARKEFRMGELLGKAAMNVLGFMMLGKLKKYRGIQASTVAKSMIYYANQPEMGLFFHESDQIQDSVSK